VFLSQAQEALSSPKSSSQLPSSVPPSSPAPPYESSFATPSLSAPSPSSPLPSSSLPSSLQLPTAARRPPQVLSVNAIQLAQPSQSPSSSSPSSPPDVEVRLTVRELLAQLGLPEEPNSLDVLQELGLLPGYNSPTASSPLPVYGSPLSPVRPVSPPYVPPQRRQASPVPSSRPVSFAPRASSASPQPSSPASSSPLPSSRAAPAPAPALGPPFIQYLTVIKGCFYYHSKHPSGFRHTHRNHCPWFHHHFAVGTCHLNDYGELCLSPRVPGKRATPLPFWNSTVSQGEQIKRRTDGTEWDEA
jgi:hypothetical protein